MFLLGTISKILFKESSYKYLMNDFVERAVFFNGRSTYKLKRANLALEG